MARNKRLELDNYDFDGELDLPNFDFGDAPKVKDDRSATTKLAFAAGKGYAEAYTNPDNVKRFIKKALPRGYGDALDVADQTAVSMKSLYNTTAKEVKPVINEIKKSAQRLVPAADKVLPKKMSKAFETWTKSLNSAHTDALNAEQMKEAGIQAELGQIFQSQAEDAHKRNVEGDARERVRDGLAFDRHKDVLQNLSPMRQSLQELSEYQRKVGINYQRKSLELQLRSYYLLNEQLEENKRQNQVTTTSLEGIMKNTGLPDFVKLKNSERLKEVIRNRFINSVGDSLADKRRHFVKNIVEHLGKKATDKFKSGVDQVRMGLGAYDSLAELREMQAQFGEHQTAGQQGAEMVGGMLADHHSNMIAGWLNKQLNKNNKLVKGGNNLLYYLQNAPQLAQEWANSSRGIGKKDFGAHSDWLWNLKDGIRSVLSPESSTVESDKLEDTRNPDVFNRRTNRSITDVMPGYLARIYRELKILRTGDDHQELVEYDYTSNKFLESSKVTKNILKKLVSSGDKDWLKRELDGMVGEIDKDGTMLSPERRKMLGRLMMNNNLAGGVGDSKKYMDASSDVYRSVERPHADAMAAAFTKYFAGDHNNLKHQTFARQFSQLGTRIGDKRGTMQDIVNINQRHHLETLGLLEPGTDNLNMEKLRDYLLADDAPETPGGAPVVNSKRGKGFKRRHKQTFVNQQHPGARTQSTVMVQQHPNHFMGGNDDVVRAIESINPITAINDSNRLLAGIIDLLNQGIAVHGAADGPTKAHKGKWWNRSVGSLLKGGATGTFDAARWLKRKAGEHTQRAFGLFGSGLTTAKDAAKGAGNWLSKQWEDFNDVYVEGDLKPRLLGWKLKAGKYYDEVTGKAITKYKDIKNGLVDENGKPVMSFEEAQKAFERSRVGKRLISTLGFVKRQGDKLFNFGKRHLPGVYGRGLDLGTKAIKKLGEFLDMPQDIYVAGKKDPVLLAVTMRAGGYASRITSNEIRRPSQIDGPVVDERGDIVLTAEQLASGLLDKYGHPIKTGVRGLFQRGKNMLKRGLGVFRGAFDRVKNFVGGAISGLTGGGFEFNFSRQARNQSTLLLQIRDMLNDRLPGERTTFAEVVEIGAAGQTGKRMLAGIKGGFSKAKEKFEKLNAKSRWEDLKERMKIRKGKAKDHMDALFEKYFGKHKVAGDEDGDGIRDGSYQDILRRKKEKLKEKAAEKMAALRKGGKGLLGTGLSKAKGAFDYLRGKKKDDGSGINIDIDGSGGSKPHGPHPEGPPKPKPKGFWGKTKGWMKGLGKGLWGVGKWGIGAGLGLGAEALGLSGLGTLVSGAGSLAMGAGGLLLDGLLATGGVVASVISAPVVLGALAVAAVGAGAYYGYKYLTKMRLDPYSTLRYAQYGFSATDDKHLQAVFAAEDMLKDAVTFDGDKGSLDEKKLDIKKLLSVLGVDAKNRTQLAGFIEWFDKRFKVVYLNSVAALRAVDPKKSLKDVGDLTATEKRKYLNIAKLPEGPYDVTASPFADQSELTVGKSEVATAAEMAEAALQKEEKSAPATGKDGAKPGASTAAAIATAAAKNQTGLPGVALPERADVLSSDPTKINQLNQKAMVGLGAAVTGAGNLTMSGPDVMADIFNTGRLDAMTALRFRTYGMKDPVADKVRALTALEATTLKGVTINKGIATWSGSTEQMISAMGSSFGVQGVANDDAYAWVSWFNTRFLPTYLAYVTAMVTATKKNTLEQAKLSLAPLQAVDVATMVYTAKGNYNGSTVSVWQIKETPWPGYETNSDVKTTEGNFQSLKDQAKQSMIVEEKANVTQGVTGNSTGSQTAEQPKTGFFAKLFADRNDPATGKPSGNIFSRIYNNAKDMLTTTAGREIQQPGKGTGGDINTIPMPKGNGSYAALKDTIAAAAKMVGVDEKLMATMAGIESSFNYTAKAPVGTATGLYQFTRDTWDMMMKKCAAKYGIDPNTPPTEPRANALLGAEFLKMNAQSLSGMGRKLTDTDLYLAHFLGAGGAKKLLSANPDDIAANVLSKEAANNPNIFFDQSRRPLSVSEVYAKINGLVQAKGKQFGLDDGSEKVLAADTQKKPDAPKTVSIPVSDQSPMPVNAKPTSGTATPAAASAAPAAATSSAAPSTDTSATPDVNMMAYSSERTRNVTAQQQIQRDLSADAFKDTNAILTSSYEVQKKLLDNSTEMLIAVKAMAARSTSPVLDKPAEPVRSANSGPARPMPKAPVSMAVNG